MEAVSPGLTVLVADKHRAVAQSLGRVVARLGHADVTEVTTSEDTLEMAVKLVPDIALVDLRLSPDCELVTRLASTCPEVRVIVMGDRTSEDQIALVKALESGAVGALYKEASIDEFARTLSASSATTPMMPAEATGLLLGSYLDALAGKHTRDVATIEALATAVEVKDVSTGQHVRRVKDLAINCMDEIDHGLAKNEEVAYGFVLHDVGKIGVPDSILGKQGPLTDAEWAVMQRHPQMGLKIVEPLGFSSFATDIILDHHERWDGSGYPAGLERDEIPLTARVFAIADSFDAMTSDRPYRAAMDAPRALEQIQEAGGRLYDPEVTEVFLELTG
ncbi:MAG TPA: HD domain-containing phosphohydrolase [Actinomycetota bacterium]|nr:HD domain-containing phosphohydrolase [Actinomycetota bacterium]